MPPVSGAPDKISGAAAIGAPAVAPFAACAGMPAGGLAHALEARALRGVKDVGRGDGQFRLGQPGAGANLRGAAQRRGEPRAMALRPQPALARHWLVDQPQHGHAAVQQAYQRAEQRPSCEKSASTVDGIQHPEVFGIASLGAVFLAHDAMGGEAVGQEGAQGAFGGTVGLGHGRGIALRLHQQRRAEQRADDRARQIRGVFRRGHQGGVEPQGSGAGLADSVRK